MNQWVSTGSGTGYYADSIQPYTPTEDEVRHEYALFHYRVQPDLVAEFDRFIAPYKNALEAVERVRGIHEAEMGYPYGDDLICRECSDLLDLNYVIYPCPTIKALDGGDAE